MELFCR